jgi:hypothetical protein
MKLKKVSKKLSINKQTIANMDMKNVYGGASEVATNCCITVLYTGCYMCPTYRTACHNDTVVPTICVLETCDATCWNTCQC